MSQSVQGASAHTIFSPSLDQSTVSHLRVTVEQFVRRTQTYAEMFVICGTLGFSIVISSPHLRDFAPGDLLIAEYPKGNNPLNTSFSAIYPADMKPKPKEDKTMTGIIVAQDSQTVTMTSLEMVEFINGQRGEDEPELLHKNFLAKVPEVLGKRSAEFLADLPDSYGRPRKGYRFPKREACLMAMSYSYELQAAVFDKMTELEKQLAGKQQMPAIPKTLPEALRLAADLAEQKQIVEYQRDEAVRTKAMIGSRREATAMARASAAVREVNKLREELGRNRHHATITAVEQVTRQKFPRNAYVALRRWCKDHGTRPMEVDDERYGKVKAWPAGAWLDVHGIDLSRLFAPATVTHIDSRRHAC
ncbi:MAG: hypothetical protein WC997_16650 [Porticoccaceae bacterium]